MWEVPIKEGIVNGLAVLKEDYPQVALLLRDMHPTPDTAVRLYLFVNWVVNRLLDPVILDAGTIGPGASISEVCCRFHTMPFGSCLLGCNTININKIWLF